MSNKALINVLRRAVRKLQKYGWIKGRMGRRSTGYCALGAIDASIRTPGLFNLVATELRTTIGTWGVADWNDDYGRSRRQVIAAFNRTIRRLEAA